MPLELSTPRAKDWSSYPLGSDPHRLGVDLGSINIPTCIGCTCTGNEQAPVASERALGKRAERYTAYTWSMALSTQGESELALYSLLSTAAAAKNRGGLRRYDMGCQRHLLHTSCRKNLAKLLLLKEQTCHNCHHFFLAFLLEYGSNNYMFKACGISSVIQILGTNVHISLTGLRSWAGVTLTCVCLLLLIALITMLTFL